MRRARPQCERDELGRALLDAPLPDAGAARERARRTVLAAHAAAPRRTRPRRVVVLAAVATLAIGAATRPGQAIGEWLGDTAPARTIERLVRDAVHAPKPATGLELPAAGRLLVAGDSGLWLVERHAAPRRLGAFTAATWSPGGLFIAAVSGRTLAAVDPKGGVRWRLTLPAPVTAPRWAPDGTHVAFRAGTTLHVVYGNGVHDTAMAHGTAPVAPAWRPGAPHTLAWASANGTVTVADADTGAVLWRRTGGPVRHLAWSADGRRLLVAARRHGTVYGLGTGERRRLGLAPGEELMAAAFAPRGSALALAVNGPSGTEVRLLGRPEPLLTPPGHVHDLQWSPDARWLLAGWPAADQWLFVRATGRPHVSESGGVERRFGRDARPQGWCCG